MHAFGVEATEAIARIGRAVPHRLKRTSGDTSISSGTKLTEAPPATARLLSRMPTRGRSEGIATHVDRPPQTPQIGHTQLLGQMSSEYVQSRCSWWLSCLNIESA